MKTVAVRLDDATIEIIERKRGEMTVSEYLRQEISPLIEGTKPISLEQCLAKLERSLLLLHVCVKPLQELLFDLQKMDTKLCLGLFDKQEKEKEPNEQSQTEPETVATSS